MEHQRTVVVMGGTTGVGKDISAHLARRGHPVAALGPVTVPVPGAGGDGPSVVETDLTEVAGYPAALDAARQLLGRIDVLVNAQDEFLATPLADLSEPVWSRVLDHNLKSVFFASQAAVPHLKAEGGLILNLGSARAGLAGTGQLAYAAAKAGVVALTRDLATDLGRYGITCNSVMLAVPGAAGVLTDPAPGPADVCEAIEFLITDGAYCALDAFDYPLDGGLSILLDPVAAPVDVPASDPDAGTVAVITGGSSGLGAAAARILARRGLRIAILDVLDDAGEEVAEEIRGYGDAAYFHCDIGSTSDITTAVDAVAARFGRIDILMNSAAITSRTRVPEITEELWDRFMDIDLMGPYYTSLACARYMRRGGGGRIINFSSMLSTLAHGRHTLYGGAKEAMNSMTRALGAGLRRDDIQVFSVLPAYVITPMISFRLQDQEWLDRNFRQSLSKVLLYPEQVTDVFAHLATSDSGASTGHKIHVDTGYLNFRYKLVPWNAPACPEGVPTHD